jgi:hypothetical protein
MKIVLVNTPKLEKRFLQVHVEVHKNNPHFIRPLDRDILSVFDPKKNKAFRHGEAVRWLLQDETGKDVGRIAAFTNRKYTNKGDQIPVGGIGFFDCQNHYPYAEKLFQTAQQWLSEKGMQAMDGPINFGERDQWWGLLIEGFDPPLYGMNYHPPYYRSFFEQYGFQVFYEQICWQLPVANGSAQLAEKFYQAHRKFAGDPDFEARNVKKSEGERFARDFCQVYNAAWAQHQGNKNMEERQALQIFKAMKPVMDEDLGWFVYYRGEPIAMWLNIPDINQAIRKLNGNFNLWSKLRFAYERWRGAITRFVGIIYGVVPEFQGTGVDYFMIVEAEKVIKARGRYQELELQWQGDFNPKMLNISRNLGAKQKRKLATYRYLFDREMPFARHPILL